MAECRAAVITAVNEPLDIRPVPIPDLEPTGMLARDNMISASYSLDRATEAFQDMASMQIVKPVIVPHA